MALQTLFAGLFGGKILEHDDLGFVASALHVGRARTMAGFASVPLRRPGLLLAVTQQLEVRIRFKSLMHFLMTAFTGFRPDVLGRRGRGRTLRTCGRRNGG